MPDASVLVVYTQPMDAVECSITTYNKKQGINWINADKISEFQGQLVTFNVAAVLDLCRANNLMPPSNLVSVEAVLKQISGLPKDQKGAHEWYFWMCLKRHWSHEHITIDRAREIVLSKSSPEDEEELKAILEAISLSFYSLWQELIVELENRSELNRFKKIESAVQRIFQRREVLGVRVDLEQGELMLQKVKQEKYDAFQALAEDFDINPSLLNIRELATALPRTDAHFLAPYAGYPSFIEYLKLARSRSRFANNFLKYHDAHRSFSTIQRLIASKGRVFPHFSTFGTVTGRILVETPPLQFLKKRFRALICADEDFVLSYLDYSQFEPGILASLSDDKALVKCYNQDDLYSSLSTVLFGSAVHRKDAKRAFLGFIFGMSANNLAALISTEDADIPVQRKRIDDFFGRFQGLITYQEDQKKKFQELGYLESLDGNRRYRLSGGDLTPKETRWACNHQIQSSGSLIFKSAIIALAKEFGDKAILLPMHDAVLMQWPNDEYKNERCEKAKLIMKQAFSEFCPEVVPIVTEEDFALA